LIRCGGVAGLVGSLNLNSVIAKPAPGSPMRQSRAGGTEMPSAVRVYGRGGDLPAGHFRSTPINRHRQTGPAVGLVPMGDIAGLA
jgi:hypothetical protein